MTCADLHPSKTKFETGSIATRQGSGWLQTSLDCCRLGIITKISR